MNKLASAAATILAGAAASTATADIVNMYFTGTDAGRSVRATYFGDSRNVFAGQLKHQINGTGPLSYLNAEFFTYCVDFAENITRDSNATFSTADLTAVPARTNPVDAIGMGRADALRFGFGGVGDLAFRSDTSNDVATAYQLAAWEIVTDYDANVGVSSFDLSQGNFRATKTNGSALWDDVDTILGDIKSRISTGENPANLLAFVNEGAQDQILLVPAPGVAVATILGGFLIASRRRRG